MDAPLAEFGSKAFLKLEKRMNKCFFVLFIRSIVLNHSLTNRLCFLFLISADVVPGPMGMGRGYL